MKADFLDICNCPECGYFDTGNEDKFSDKNGRLFIIYTVEQMKKDLQKSQPTIVKLTKQLEDKGLIEKVRQGQGKPTRIYIKDFASALHHEPEKPGSKDRELSEVKTLNSIYTENIKTENIEHKSYLPSTRRTEGWMSSGARCATRWNTRCFARTTAGNWPTRSWR